MGLVWLFLVACGPRVVGQVDTEPYPTDRVVLVEDALTEFSAYSIVDVRGSSQWAQGHIPGSIPVFPASLYDESLMDDPEAFADETRRRVTALGLDEPVLVVGDPTIEWGTDGYAYWLLRVAGLEQVSVLNGGAADWQNAGGEWTPTESSLPDPLEPAGAARPDFLAPIDSVTSFVQNNGILLDTRSREEWEEGRIPGARFWKHGAKVWPDGRLRPAEILLDDLAQIEVIDPNEPVMVYCQSGVRAGHSFFVLEALGFEAVTNYAGSIEAWRSAGYALETGSDPP